MHLHETTCFRLGLRASQGLYNKAAYGGPKGGVRERTQELLQGITWGLSEGTTTPLSLKHQQDKDGLGFILSENLNWTLSKSMLSQRAL